ncbi:hypothetical protein ACFXDE_36770 [Kitasatospora sp. NPDC059408]|uniref:hypothetical protein n=1 Tax=Kitasatospora sp. NPDC059408 TaxID=3346823 RepID=UPI0036CD8A81
MSERVRRGCAVVAKVVLAGAVGLAVWVYLSLRPEPQPDVGKAARSATARAADRALTVQLDGQIDRLRAALPWAAYLGTTVADVCTTDSTTTAFTFTRQRWLPVTCTRTTTMYEAFDGDFLERLGQLDAALTAAQWRADWRGYPSYPRPRPGLVAAYDYSRPSPTSGAPDGAPLPGSASVRYDVPITSDFVPPADSMTRGKPSGSVEVVQGPHLPNLDDGTSAHDTALKYPTVKTHHYVDWQQYSHARLAADAYPAHGAVLAVSITGSYNTGP